MRQFVLRAVLVLALAAAAGAAPGASATPDKRPKPKPPTAAQTRAALVAAPSTWAQTAAHIALETLDQRKKSVSLILEQCARLEAHPEQAATVKAWPPFTAAWHTFAREMTREGNEQLYEVHKFADALRPYLPALEPSRRAMLDRALALISGARQAWGEAFFDLINAADKAADKKCSAALEEFHKYQPARSQAGEASTAALHLLQELARTA